uniref:G-patch domain-containing protein n=2 Tax=Meloidogyne incognita group TaxID=654580 RepID=A0A914M243_MELIC
MVYGTPFEQLEDEAKSAVSKKPKGIQDEIVTDERGRRRFHGAFTGGFSAGYFNTAGSRHGWVPQTFKSTRTERGERFEQMAEDFMDEEDFGEFGIASRKFRTKSDFMDTLAAPGEERLLAWERAGTSTNNFVGNEGSMANKLNSLLRPVNDSIGIRILRKMGWRPGKGVGAKMTRRALERQKLIDAESSGKEAEFDEETVRDIEEIIPTADFSPDDIKPVEICQKEDVHGMGYKPLQEIGVLSEKYGRVTASLKKTNCSGKGIRGQAFGVGAFEEDDEDIYTNYDLTQYDFEVGSTQSTQLNVPKFDSTFIPSSSSMQGKNSFKSQKFFVADTPPPGWRPSTNRTKSLLFSGRKEISKKLPEAVAKLGYQLTPVQRAKLLGGRDHSVMEMLSNEQRAKLKINNFAISDDSKNDNREHHSKHTNDRHRMHHGLTAQPFEEEPLKAHRFRQYVNYLKRGIPFIQPPEMTLLQWESEKADFEEALPSELRALLKDVQERQKPLARLDFARPIAEHLKNRFALESGVDKEDYEKQIKHESSIKSNPQLEAVGSNQFGTATRQLHEWHPAPDLCKRFNVSNPYPDSQILGVPGLSGQRYGGQKDYSSEYSLIELAGNLGGKSSTDGQHRRHPSRFDQTSGNEQQHQSIPLIKNEVKETTEKKINSQKKIEFAPIVLLTAIFGDDDIEDDETQNEDEDEEDEEALIHLPKKKQEKEIKKEDEQKQERPIISKESIITILDIVEDDNVYGPAMPPTDFLEEKCNQENNFQLEIKNGSSGNDIITIESGIDEDNSDYSDDSSDSEEEERRKRKKEKKRKKKMKKKEKKLERKKRTS